MADLVMGAMPSIIPKLCELLKEEYNLQTGMKERISSLTQELEHAQAALCKVAEVPWDQLDKNVQIWARHLREASYDMEDVLDTFLVRVQGPESAEEKQSFWKLLKKMAKSLKKGKTRRRISGDVTDIITQVQNVTEQCRRYKVGDIPVAMPDTASAVDPRLHAMYNKVQDLVGLDESSGELISKLQPLQQDGASNLKMKIVSIVGVGGLGKTTLAKAVYDKLKGDFNCSAFVPVGRNPDLKKIFKDILIDLDMERYLHFSTAALDERQLIDELRKFFLENKKRYLIIIDDLWEIESWETIKLAIDDEMDYGGRIIITTRKLEVATKADEVYRLQPLPYDSSRELLYTRIYGHEGRHADSQPNEISDKFIRKCGGIPLAIITMASLLAGKPRERWDELYRCIGFGSEDNKQAQNTMQIISFSYFDLPAHLRTCLLYLSAFPEDSVIDKVSLVWMWVAERFVKKKQGERSFETGEGYFHDLINRSMLEAVKSHIDDSIVTGCRVHDMVLDFIRSMSHQDNFFSVVLDNDQGPLLDSNNVPRRLAHHNRTMRHGHCQGDDSKMAKVRSFFAIGCGIQASNPFHGFMLLRVLVVDNCKATEGRFGFQLVHVGHLLHLRFLSIRRTSVERIPEEIGRLRFLQTLELKGSSLQECPSPESLPEQLVRLCLFTGGEQSYDGIFSLTRLTSLEELSIYVSGRVSWCLPTELRVLELELDFPDDREATERDFWECVHHLNKLEHLTISGSFRMRMHVTDFVLPSRLQHFAVGIRFCKLPSCVNSSCLPNLSHLELRLEHLDEDDLKILGMLPELRFLFLYLRTSATVSSVIVVSEKDAGVVYFPKLWCCMLRGAMISFHANEEDKSISFHMWGGGRNAVGKHKLQRPIISCSTGGGGGTSAGATGGGAPRDRFMPCLQVFRFAFPSSDRWDDRCWDNLGLEYGLPSLREIVVHPDNDKVKAALRSTAEAHPNRPAFRDSWALPWYQPRPAVPSPSNGLSPGGEPPPLVRPQLQPLPDRRPRLLLPRPLHQHLRQRKRRLRLTGHGPLSCISGNGALSGRQGRRMAAVTVLVDWKASPASSRCWARTPPASRGSSSRGPASPRSSAPSSRAASASSASCPRADGRSTTATPPSWSTRGASPSSAPLTRRHWTTLTSRPPAPSPARSAPRTLQSDTAENGDAHGPEIREADDSTTADNGFAFYSEEPRAENGHETEERLAKEAEDGESVMEVECRGLDHADALGLIAIGNRLRCISNWLVVAGVQRVRLEGRVGVAAAGAEACRRSP